MFEVSSPGLTAGGAIRTPVQRGCVNRARFGVVWPYRTCCRIRHQGEGMLASCDSETGLRVVV